MFNFVFFYIFFSVFWFIIFIYFFFIFLMSLLLWGENAFSGMFSVDGISFFLIFLTSWIFVFCFCSQLIEKWKSNYFFSFMFFVSMIFMFLFLSFSCLNIFLFYVCFEFIFLLMFFFLLSWGYSPERLQASFYMVFYTLIVSFPFLVFVVFFGILSYSNSFKFITSFSNYWWLFIFCVFMVKLPVFGVHLWLPKAHVEAPVSGSMVLAGVLLKLGAYGFLRFFGMFSCSLYFYVGYMVSLGILGGFISCFLCMRQVDLKAFVAYSSICHMGMMMSGLSSYTFLGLLGGIYMLIGHGFCSSCLFYILYMIYERFHSRSSMILKGVLYLFPVLGMGWFLFCALNMGVPPSLSFFSEVFMIIGMGNFDFSLMLFGGLFLFFAGVYGIYLFIISNHGFSFLFNCYSFLNVREILLFYGHFVPMFSLVILLGVFF